jgi:hypothetical protein
LRQLITSSAKKISLFLCRIPDRNYIWGIYGKIIKQIAAEEMNTTEVFENGGAE